MLRGRAATRCRCQPRRPARWPGASPRSPQSLAMLALVLWMAVLASRIAAWVASARRDKAATLSRTDLLAPSTEVSRPSATDR